MEPPPGTDPVITEDPGLYLARILRDHGGAGFRATGMGISGDGAGLDDGAGVPPLLDPVRRAAGAVSRVAGRGAPGATMPSSSPDCQAALIAPMRRRARRALFSSGPASTDGTWPSLVGHLTGGQGVAGSNPAVPTDVSAGQGRFLGCERTALML